MTVISVGIGSAFKSLPDVLKSSLPIGQYLGAALMLLFGVRTISVCALTPEIAQKYDSQIGACRAPIPRMLKNMNPNVLPLVLVRSADVDLPKIRQVLGGRCS